MDSTFINNTANYGGSMDCDGKVTIIDSTFINNTARNTGGALLIGVDSSIVNCIFVNSKSVNSNGIHLSNGNLNIDDGKGIVYIFNEGTLSGISIVVLKNETYYHPPNPNINFFKKHDLFDYILVSLVHFYFD